MKQIMCVHYKDIFHGKCFLIHFVKKMLISCKPLSSFSAFSSAESTHEYCQRANNKDIKIDIKIIRSIN